MPEDINPVDDLVVDSPAVLTCATTGGRFYVIPRRVVAVQPMSVMSKAGFVPPAKGRPTAHAVIYLESGSPGFMVEETADEAARILWGVDTPAPQV